VAQIYQPTYTFTDPKTGKKVRQKSKTWWIRYYDVDKKRQKVKGDKSRARTMAKAVELEQRARRAASGVIDPSEDHAKTPLAEHAEDFRRHLTNKGNTADHIAKSLFRLTTVLDRCHFVRIADIQPSAVQECLATLRRDGKSIKTTNDYLWCAKAFTRWLWRDRRMLADPLAAMSGLARQETDVRHARRDFTPDELRVLLDAAKASGQSVRKLTGPQRYFLYLTACATGFRASELLSMTRESFNLDSDPPTATVKATYTKNGQLAHQPLPRDVAEALRPFLATKPASAQVWPGKWNRRAFLMIQIDLAAARKKWLSGFQEGPQRDQAERSDFLTYQDDAGRFADFHSLRHSFITMIGKTGVTPKEHQDLARHSTYALTGRYTHSRLYDLAAAVNALPNMLPKSPEEDLAATGTDGKKLGPKTLAHTLAHTLRKIHRAARHVETNDVCSSQSDPPGKHAVSYGFSRSEADMSEVDTRGTNSLVFNAAARRIDCIAPAGSTAAFQQVSCSARKTTE
jgi:site-specific recombinase XerD